MSVRTAMLVPLTVACCVGLIGLLTLGAGAVISSNRAADALATTTEITGLALKTASAIEETQRYTSDILAMTHITDQGTVSTGFYTRLGAEQASIGAMRILVDDGPLAPKVAALIDAERFWRAQAEVLLGLAKGDAIPTSWSLEQSAQRVQQLTETIVAESRAEAAETVLSAPAAIRDAVLLIGAFAAIATAFAVVLATRMSNRISNAMRDVSRSLFDLADLDDRSAGQRRNEISDMRAALNVLRSSVHEKERMSKDLAREKARAEEAARTKSRFLANMSHEIRTPINGILGMAEILEATELNTEQLECARTILSSSEALLSVINSILDFSKNESGETVLQDVPFSLEEIVYDVALLLGPAIGGAEVEVCVDYATGLPRHFRGDPGRIRQVVMNLVGNAVKFTPAGHVTISVDYNAKAPRPLSICVRDTGVGIPEDKLDAVFLAFQQVDMQATRRFDGTGLGLAITQQLVTLFGGQISVTSTLGEGAAFKVDLPLPVTDTPPENAPVAEALSDLSGKTVLVVDDLALNRAILQRRLHRWRMAVHLFADAPQALDALGKDPDLANQIDVAIVDYHMPSQTGEDLAKSLKEMDNVRDFPIILYSSSDRSAEIDGLKASGISSVLMKPARAEVMEAALANALSLATAPSPARPVPVPQEQQFADLRVLVAEDNRTNRLVVKRMLQSAGVDPLFAKNGAEAIDKYRATGADVIFMDMSMPVMDGLTATRRIREFEAENDLTPVPIIALTANALEEDQHACKAAGMTGFLSKPVRKHQLLSHLSQRVFHSNTAPDNCAKNG